MTKRLVSLNSARWKGIALIITAAMAASSLLGINAAPQDRTYAPDITIPLQEGDGTSFLLPVLQNDLVYYGFNDATNLRRGIRVRDLDGNLVHEILQPGYSGYDIGRLLVANNGTIYAVENRSGTYLIHIYTLADGSYSETASFGPEGPETGSFSSAIFSRSTIDISPVSGKIFLKEDYFPATGGEMRVYDAAGNFLNSIQTNGILAPTLEGSIRDIQAVAGPDNTGEVWVRANYGSSSGTNSQWYKVFDEDGNFIRLFDMTSNSISGNFVGDLMYISASVSYAVPLTADTITGNQVGYWYSANFLISFEGKDSLGRFVDVTSTEINIYQQPVFRTFDPISQNAIPNPFVYNIQQREATTVLDIDYRVEDADDATVTTAALAFPDGDQNILNALPLTTFSEGTESNLGTGMATNTSHRISWNAGVDWNVDFGSISVMILARDNRTYYFDVHFVDIPADGERPAVTISRNMLEEYDFTMQWFWLIATNDPSISITDGIIFGQGGSYDGQQLTDSQGKSTSAGRAFLLERDGLRTATADEIVRAREGATPGFTVQLTPPNRILSNNPSNQTRFLPLRINEYGIESWSSSAGTFNYTPTSGNLWYVVPIAP